MEPFLKQLQRQFLCSSLYLIPADSPHLKFVENNFLFFLFNTQGWITFTPTYFHFIHTPSLSVVLCIPLASRILTLLASAVYFPSRSTKLAQNSICFSIQALSRLKRVVDANAIFSLILSETSVLPCWSSHSV